MRYTGDIFGLYVFSISDTFPTSLSGFVYDSATIAVFRVSIHKLFMIKQVLKTNTLLY